MIDSQPSRLVPFETRLADRRSGVDRRRGADRRRVDLFLETGRPCFDLREKPDRRSGEDRRQPARMPVAAPPEFVTAWQITPTSREV